MKKKEYLNSDMEKVIDEYVHSERDRKVLKRRHIDGICFEPLAEEFKLSVTQIKRIVYKYEVLIFKKLKEVETMKKTIQGN